MEWNYILIWFVGLGCVSPLVRLWRIKPIPVGWVVVYSALLVALLTTWWLKPDIAGLAVAGPWLVFGVAPSLILLRARRCALRQQYAAAARLARLTAWLHPFDGLWIYPRMFGALDLAHRGRIDAAIAELEELASMNSRIARVAQLHLFRLREQWPQLVEWVEANYDQRALQQDPSVLGLALRGLGETGQIDRLLEMIDGHRARIDSPAHAHARAMCRLQAFAFTGQVSQTEALMAGPLRILPIGIQQFWIATAEMTAGRIDAGRKRFGLINSSGDPRLREVIEQRLRQLPAAPVLSARAASILDALERERDQEMRFAYISQSGRRAWATYTLILANLVMFAVESLYGGSTDTEVLYRLGAVVPPDMTDGQYWRLFTANFLHLGAAHIAMNMFALLVLGPFVEASMGWFWYLLLYLASGTSSMAVVFTLQYWKVVQPEFLVGASGAIMALVGATAAILLRGMKREGSRIARRRFPAVISIVAIQIVFDQLTPQVSGAAHLAGVFIGFVLACVLPHRKPSVRSNAGGVS